MAAKLFLAESTANAIGTHTVYTVPTDKAARIRIMFQTKGSGGAGHFAIQIGAGTRSETIFSTAVAAEHENWTGFRFDGTDGYPKDIGMHSEQSHWDDTTNAAEKDWVTPIPIDYYLSAGDTVNYICTSSTLGDRVLFQVMGVEDDV